MEIKACEGHDQIQHEELSFPFSGINACAQKISGPFHTTYIIPEALRIDGQHSRSSFGSGFLQIRQGFDALVLGIRDDL